MLLHFAGVKAFYTLKVYDESIIACPTLIAKRFLNISAEAFSSSVGGNSDSRQTPVGATKSRLSNQSG